MKLDACLYCPGSTARNRRQAKRLRDTRANRAREELLFKYMTYGVTIIRTPRRRRRSRR